MSKLIIHRNKNTVTTLIKYLLIIFLINLLNIHDSVAETITYEPRLKQIDIALDKKNNYVRKKENQLKFIKEQLAKTVSIEEKFTLTKMLIDEYKTFDSDSTFHYINKNIKLAEEDNNSLWKNEMLITKLYIAAATSLNLNISDYIKDIDYNHLTNTLLRDLYTNIWFYYHHINEYNESAQDSIEYDYLNKAISLTDHKDIRYNYLLSHVAGTDTISVIKGLKDNKRQIQESSSEYAKISYELAKIYKAQKDTANYIHELSAAALADLKNANRETIALQELASFLYKKRNINRAYAYLQSSFNDARIYKAALRTIEISQILPEINEAYQLRHIIQTENLKQMLSGLILIAIFLICAIIIILYQYRKIKRSRAMINAAHDKLRIQLINITKTHEDLNCSNGKLRELNIKLSDANYLKEEYIGYVFKICSAYIDKLDEVKKNISRNIKTKRYDEILRICDNTTGSNDELKELYSSFDRIFLKIFPDFINQVNKLLYPDKQFLLKEDEFMTPELRILALIRLGINENAQIANFLHYS